MIKAIIIDDEQSAIDRLTELLSEHCKYSVHLLGSFTSVEEGIKAI